MQPKTGDTVEVIQKKGENLTGKFIPSPNTDIITIKLESGYNVAIPGSNIKSMKIIESAKPVPVSSTPEPKVSGPLIVVLSTGGTIASRVDYKTGAVTPVFSPGQILLQFPELRNIATIETHQLFNELSGNIDFNHYNEIARAIQTNSKKAKGIIIAHGTDTMHYTASALSFMLEGLKIPVILVGSQRSSDRGSSDSALNFLSAALFIQKTDYAGVGICMHASSDDTICHVLRPHNARKMHSTRRDTFRPINCRPLAEINFSEKSIKYLSMYQKVNDSQIKNSQLNIRPFKEQIKVGWIRARPHVQPEEILACKSFDGLIIEGTGLGHITMLNDDIKKAIKLLSAKMPVIMATQCLYGRVDMDVYSYGRELLSMGIIPCKTGLTPETAYIKLAWLLSNYPQDKVAGLFAEDLCGENISRIGEDTFLW